MGEERFTRHFFVLAPTRDRVSSRVVYEYICRLYPTLQLPTSDNNKMNEANPFLFFDGSEAAKLAIKASTATSLQQEALKQVVQPLLDRIHTLEELLYSSSKSNAPETTKVPSVVENVDTCKRVRTCGGSTDDEDEGDDESNKKQRSSPRVWSIVAEGLTKSACLEFLKCHRWKEPITNAPKGAGCKVSQCALHTGCQHLLKMRYKSIFLQCKRSHLQDLVD